MKIEKTKETMDTLKKITGSEKQIKWAESIRASLMAEFSTQKLMEKEPAKFAFAVGLPGPDEKIMAQGYELFEGFYPLELFDFKEKLMFERDSKFFISNRSRKISDFPYRVKRKGSFPSRYYKPYIIIQEDSFPKVTSEESWADIAEYLDKPVVGKKEKTIRVYSQEMSALDRKLDAIKTANAYISPNVHFA